MIGPFLLYAGLRGRDALATAGETPAVLDFLLVDLASFTDHNPQLRLVLTLAGRGFPYIWMASPWSPLPADFVRPWGPGAGSSRC